MRIAVIVKQIPNPEARLEIVNGQLVRGGDELLSELDENAIEAALQLAGAAGGEVVALTMGPDQGELAVRRALQLGASDAFHVCDDALAGSDVLATARALAAAIGKIGGVELVVTGMGALDGRTSLVPPALAALLGFAPLTMARSVELTDGEVRIERAVDDAVEQLAAPLPALVSVTDQANTPRFPNVKGIMAAKKKPVTRWTLADLGLDPGQVGQAGSGSHVVEATQTPAKAGPQLFPPTAEGAAALADYLVSNRIVTEVKA